MHKEVVNSGSDKNKPTSDVSPEPAKTQRDIWDYFEILARPVSAFITALAVASLGLFANMAINKNNHAAALNAEGEQNTRLYTELLSQREQADSNLRKDMFNTILQQFLTVKDKTPEGKLKSFSDRMLKLELLALNFGEALTLRPLFQEMNRSIETEAELMANKHGSNSGEAFRGLLKPRLESLARRVSDQQISALNLGGKTLFVEAPRSAIGRRNENEDYQWQYYEAKLSWDNLKTSKGFNPSGLSEEDWIEEEVPRHNTITIGGIKREYTMTLSGVNPKNSEVTVNLSIQDLEGPPGVTLSLKAVEMKFKLNYFNFPLIDNTRLSGNQRFALVLTKFNEDVINIVGICFPGVYASQRDKPFLNDVIDQLKKKKMAIEQKLEQS